MEHVPRSTEHKHEFNNFATHYHMLLNEQIYTIYQETKLNYFRHITT